MATSRSLVSVPVCTIRQVEAGTLFIGASPRARVSVAEARGWLRVSVPALSVQPTHDTQANYVVCGGLVIRSPVCHSNQLLCSSTTLFSFIPKHYQQHCHPHQYNSLHHSAIRQTHLHSQSCGCLPLPSSWVPPRRLSASKTKRSSTTPSQPSALILTRLATLTSIPGPSP